MKTKRLFLLGLTAVFAAACMQEQAETPQVALPEGEEIEAGTEVSDPATRTYLKEKDVLWAEGDCITAYLGTDAKSKYRLKEGAGTTYGKFTKVTGALTGDPIPANYAVYSSGDVIYDKGKLLVDIPGVQTFVPNSFGPGTNTMVAVSDTKIFGFKNLCGYFVLPLVGNVTVKSITIAGGESEALAGRAVVSFEKTGPVIEEIRRGLTELKVNCDEPFALDKEEPVEFWFVVPPTYFKMGMQIEIEYNNGEIFECSPPAKSFSIARNSVYRMAPLEVMPKE